MQARRQPASELLVHAGVAAERVVGQLELVALAHEHAKRAVAVARRPRDDREAAPQELERRLELAVVVALADQDQEGEMEAALALLRRRCTGVPQTPRERDRALGMLVRKGYGLELAHDALRRFAGADEAF